VQPPWRDWHAPLGREDEQLNRIYDLAARATVTPADLVARARAADFLLLGEKHDNPDHHRLQAWLIDSLARSGRRRALVLEMLTPAQETQLRARRATHPEDVDGFADAVDWSDGGWPAWPLYRPIFAVAARHNLPILGGEIAAENLAGLRRQGLAALSSDVRTRLSLEPGLDASARESLGEEIRAGHCGMANDAMVDAMIDVQRVRDASLADALVRADETMPAVLIAGAGHTRKDRAVPLYLARRAPDKHVLAVAFFEVGREAPPLDELAQAYDFVWFTPRVDDLDPCERFHEQLERMKHPR
jgi:uncharacterized iron-regulated protein